LRFLYAVAGDGQKEVHGDRFGVERREFICDVREILRCFVHAHDEAGAELEVRLARRCERVEAILVGMRGADVRVVRTRRVEVVVEPVEAGITQTHRFLFIEQARREACFKPEAFFHFADATCHVIDVRVGRPAPREIGRAHV